MIEDYQGEIESLASAIETEIKEGENGVENITLLGVALKVPASVMVPFMKGLEDPETMARKIAEGYRKNFAEEDYFSLIADIDNKEIYLNSYHAAVKAKIKTVTAMVINLQDNIEIIKNYTPKLRTLKLQSVKTDRWGDQDYSGWARILDEFSSEKLHGGSWEKIFENLLSPISAHFERIGQTNTLAKLAGAIYEAEVSKLGEGAVQEDCITGEDFERKIKSMIENAFNHATVELTPRTGDHGADLLVYINDVKIAIQAKFYASPVGNSAVQEIYSAKDFYEADFAVVVTSSAYTPAAATAATKLNIVLTNEDSILPAIKAMSE